MFWRMRTHQSWSHHSLLRSHLQNLLHHYYQLKTAHLITTVNWSKLIWKTVKEGIVRMRVMKVKYLMKSKASWLLKSIAMKILISYLNLILIILSITHDNQMCLQFWTNKLLDYQNSGLWIQTLAYLGFPLNPII